MLLRGSNPWRNVDLKSDLALMNLVHLREFIFSEPCANCGVMLCPERSGRLLCYVCVGLAGWRNANESL